MINDEHYILCGSARIPRTHLALNLHDVTTVRRIVDVLLSCAVKIQKLVKLGSPHSRQHRPLLLEELDKQPIGAQHMLRLPTVAEIKPELQTVIK